MIIRNMKVLMVLSIIILIAFAGCTEKKEQTIQTPGQEVKVSEGAGVDWCKKGTKITSTDANGELGTYEVKGFADYEGKEVCLSVMTYDLGSIEIYTNEDSTFSVMIYKDKSGKIINKLDVSKP